MDSGRVKEIQADCKGRMRWKGRLQGAAAIASGVQWTRAWALAAVRCARARCKRGREACLAHHSKFYEPLSMSISMLLNKLLICTCAASS